VTCFFSHSSSVPVERFSKEKLVEIDKEEVPNKNAKHISMTMKTMQCKLQDML
jgi:hypothetical protein